jgi:mannan endo-1,4-beta-mannosidase
MDGSSGVDSQDILNIPDIGFGSFQVFPDQNSYGPNDPSLDPVQNKINSSLAWIQQSAQSAAVVGKPVVLSAFGLVTQSNLNDFVPFNMTYAPYTSSTAAMEVTAVAIDATATTNFANNAQQEQGYTSFMQMGLSAGLAGTVVNQGIPQSSAGIQLDKTNSTTPVAGWAATEGLPNDGYSIANNTAITRILEQGAQAMAENS